MRSSAPHGVLSRLIHHEQGDAVVLYHGSFRPLLELAVLEAYAAQLEQAAAHGNAGTLGCFVDISTHGDGVVRVALFERWFDGEHLRCEQLAAREFESTAERVVVDAAEFLADLRAWAETRNEEREANGRNALAAEIARSERAMDRAEAAAELASILELVDEDP